MSLECCFCMEPTQDTCTECTVSCCSRHLYKHRLGGFCQPWKISQKPGIGRVLLASRNISAWERVVYDEALVVVPDYIPVCLACLDKVNGDHRCEKCLWPMCGKEECKNHPNHEIECKVFSGKNLQPQIEDYSAIHWAYSALAILRVILTSQTSLENKEALEMFMSHVEDWKSDTKVCEGLARVWKFLETTLAQSSINEEQVQHVFGALKTNSVGYTGKDGRVLFPLLAVASHSCAANLEATFDPREKAMFRAKTNIREGEELCIRYTDHLTSKFLIQRKLKEEWLFDCQCVRCLDSTEFGSYFSSLKCDCEGFFSKAVKDDIKEKLVCSNCHLEKDLFSQLKSETDILQTIQNLNDEAKLLELEETLLKSKNYHENHYLLFALRRRYLDIVDIKSVDDLRKVSRLSKHVIDVLQLIEPGCTKIFGRYLSLMLESEMRLLTDAKKSNRIDENEFRLRMKQVIQGRLKAVKLQSNFVK